MNLREEFEPVLISSHGLHLTPELCQAGWDSDGPSGRHDDYLSAQIARADEWLRLQSQTKHINTRIGTSYGLKHEVERWHRENRSNQFLDCYVSNGCFLMAAHRLGFRMRGRVADYCWGPKFIRDCFNAYITISLRLAGEGSAERLKDRTGHPLRTRTGQDTP
jgi:hypothetical protein